MYTTEELLANLPDFERVRIQGGRTPYAQPALPGEERLMPNMQEKLQPALPPVRKAQRDADEFLSSYLLDLLAGAKGGQGFAMSPSAAESLASIEYLGRGRTDFNPSVADRTISTRAQEIMRGS